MGRRMAAVDDTRRAECPAADGAGVDRLGGSAVRRPQRGARRACRRNGQPRAVDTGRIVLIGGEAGTGKTRLAAELARRLHATGAAVLYGTCDDDLALPYQPWVQALDPVVPILVAADRQLAARLTPLVAAAAQRRTLRQPGVRARRCRC